MSRISKVAKAASAAVVGLMGWGTAVVESAPSGVTTSEWIGLGTVVLAVIAVWAVPNAE